jgi:filamentous hemagglutinin
VEAGTGVQMAAGHDLNATAATVATDKGGIALAAKNDVNLEAGTETHAWEQQTKKKKSGFLSSKTTTTYDATEDNIAVGTLLSGDTVTVAAGHDITAKGVQIAATEALTMAAGNNLTIGTADSSHSETHDKTVKKSGLMSGGGFSIMIGASKEDKGYDQTDYTPTGSVIGSTQGAVTLTAGNTVHITGSDVLSQQSTTIVGKNVTIDAAVATTDARETYKKQTAGITLGLTGGVVDAVTAASGAAHRGSEVDDNRLKALYAAKAAYAVGSGIGSYQQAVGQTGSAAGGISLRIGIGASSASSETKTHEQLTYGSGVRSQGDVTIAATNGDLNVVGSSIKGENIALAATNDLNLLSQAEDHTSKSTNRNGAGEIGFSIGSQTGIYVSASAGRGKAVGNGVTHAETTVDASGNLSIVSGNNTTIQGAQLRGDSVVAAVGNDLLIKSEQDTDDYASKQQQGSISVTFGYGGSGSYSQSKTKSHYDSVNEISGISAGDGGFQVAVGGNTHLVGGVIASSADPSKNYLSTGTLTWEDIHNEASYKSGGFGISGSFSSGKQGQDGAANPWGAAGGSASPSLGLTLKGNSQSDTESSITAGTIAVRDGPVDLSGLKRDGTLDGSALKPIFDEKKLAEQQELFQGASQLGYSVVKTVVTEQRDAAHSRLQEASAAYQSATTDEERASALAARDAAMADMNHWSDSGSYKIASDVLTGTVSAYLGGGSVAGAAGGALANERFLGAISAGLNRNGIDAVAAEKSGAMSLAAIGLGYGVDALVGGGNAGAATGNAAQTYGYYDYRDGRAQTVQWEHDKLQSITGGDEAVKAARERIIDEAIKDGADPTALAAALTTPGIDDQLNGLAVVEAASYRMFNGASFNDLSDAQKAQVMEGLAGTVTVGPVTSLGGGSDTAEAAQQQIPSKTAEETRNDIRQAAGLALTGFVTNGELGVEKAVNWIGADNAESLGYAVAVATGGPAKFGLGYVLDKSGISGQIQAGKQEYLIDPAANWIGEYGFGAQTPEQLGLVHPASNTVATVAVDATLAVVGGAIRDTAKSIVKQSDGFTEKVADAENAATNLGSSNAEAINGEAIGGRTCVYSCVVDGETRYVGITDDIAKRGQAHMREKGITIDGIDGLQGLSRSDARAVEQTLIEYYGLGKDGGSLINKINSISPTKNPTKYEQALIRGAKILRSINYKGF